MCVLALLGVAWSQPQVGKTILDYGPQLGLDDGQMGQLRTTVTTFMERSASLKKQLKTAESVVASQTQKRLGIDKIRQSVEASEEIRTQIRLNDVVTSRKIRTILTVQQWAQWEKIKQGASKQS
jgi:hypothetical protein